MKYRIKDNQQELDESEIETLKEIFDGRLGRRLAKVKTKTGAEFIVILESQQTDKVLLQG